MIGDRNAEVWERLTMLLPSSGILGSRGELACLVRFEKRQLEVSLAI